MSPSYKVVIPFYKNETQLAKCVKALPQNTKPVIIDDSLTGNGFTHTVNKGIKKVLLQPDPPSYIFIVNQDCYLAPNAVKTALAFMEAHPKCAIAGVKQISSSNPDHIIHGGTKQCYPNGVHDGGSLKKGDCAVNKQVPWVNGACMVVRVEALMDFGLMDPNYKMFASDADWSYTARARGWETWYMADVSAVHEQGISKTQTKEMANIFEIDMTYFRDKWITGEVYRDLSLEVF